MFLIVVLFASNGYASTVYKWVDKSGAVSFSDDYTNIPREYRNQLQTEQLEDYPRAQPSALPAVTPTPSQKMEGPKTDIYGMGPDYWKDKVRPSEQMLKEAQDNIQAVDAKIQEQDQRIKWKILIPHTVQHEFNSSFRR